MTLRLRKFTMENETADRKAERSLDGLSLGDAFGELFLSRRAGSDPRYELPPGPWRWTDDTHMAVSITEVLKTHGHVDQDALAAAFARRYQQEPWRGYSADTGRLLSQIAAGADWRNRSLHRFGIGSYGNGAAMRAAPIGGYFSGHPERAACEAQRSAVITHAHPEGQAGAIAVAVAAALAGTPEHPAGGDLLRRVQAFVPPSLVRQKIELSLTLAAGHLDQAAQRLGTGYAVTAQDTVPFCLWVAAHYPEDFETALWQTVRGRGDCDTTCAIVGGIVALSAPSLPSAWLDRREPLPALAASGDGGISQRPCHGL